MEPQQTLHKALCTNCLTGERKEITFNASHDILQTLTNAEIYFGPALIDLQINGINGVDFNDANLQEEALLTAAKQLLARGVAIFLPTIITNSKPALLGILSVIHSACIRHELLQQCIAGIHLEGPFISNVEGARGAHDPQYSLDPDWDFFEELQHAAGGRVRLITIAPERKGSAQFIQQCINAGIKVAIGHSLADEHSLNAAVKAGADMSTHLGNGVPLMLPRHNNILWEQLAQPNLFCGFIGDGFHIPASFIKVLLQVKKEKAILVSDATQFTGMPSGRYQAHIGGDVELDDQGRLSLQLQPGMLAGSASDLLQAIEWLTATNICSLREAWACASVHPASYLGVPLQKRVVFFMRDNRIRVLDTQ